MTPFLYVYLVGGLVFCAGLFYAWRGGYIDGSARGIRNLLVCLFVALFFMTIQGYLQFAPMKTLPAEKYGGGAEHVVENVETLFEGTLSILIASMYL